MNRLELQTLAIRGEIPLVPIGVTHLERQVEKPALPPYASELDQALVPAPPPRQPWETGEYERYVPAQETIALEVPYDKDPSTGPLVFAFIKSTPVCSPFFLLHYLKVGSTTLIDDVRGIHFSMLSRQVRLAPARFVQGDKIVLKVKNLDAACHSFYAGLFFAKDET